MTNLASPPAPGQDDAGTGSRLVLVGRDGPGVATLTLNDHPRRNAITPEMEPQLAAAVAEVAADPEARVLIVTGTGSAFCAGADLAATFGPPADPLPVLRRRLLRLYGSFLAIARLEIPTIAAVHGPAVGAGVNLALACDVRIAGPRARFGITFSRLGLHPGGGASWFLTRAVGRQRALSLLLDGATVDAPDALRLGLVLDLADDPLTAARERARRWAALDPDLLRNVKRTVAAAELGPLPDTVELESWAQAASARAGDPARFSTP
jgi:enoyl-CoA hydratase